MNTKKWILGCLLFLLGFAGILSLLGMDLPIPEETKKILLSRMSENQLRWLALVNPSLMLLFAVSAGVVLHDKVQLSVPLLKSFVWQQPKPALRPLLIYGTAGGILAGLLVLLVGALYQSHMPEEFLRLSQQLKPGLAVRFLYGGITEEILMRFGLMTFVVWLLSLFANGLRPVLYWLGMMVAALLFALGHVPVAILATGEPSSLLLSYIFIGNTPTGIIFGWLYWKKGLESAFIAHIMTHVVILLGEFLFV